MGKRNERVVTLRPFRNQAGILAVIADEVLANLQDEGAVGVRFSRILIEPEGNRLVASCIITRKRPTGET